MIFGKHEVKRDRQLMFFANFVCPKFLPKYPKYFSVMIQ